MPISTVSGKAPSNAKTPNKPKPPMGYAEGYRRAYAELAGKAGKEGKENQDEISRAVGSEAAPSKTVLDFVRRVANLGETMVENPDRPVVKTKKSKPDLG